MIEILYHTLWETVHVFFDHHQWVMKSATRDFCIRFWEGQTRNCGCDFGSGGVHPDESAG